MIDAVHYKQAKAILDLINSDSWEDIHSINDNNIDK
jgi:hypothetical protein